MGSFVYLKKGKQTIEVGRTHHVFDEVPHPLTKEAIQECIDDIINDTKKWESDIRTLVAYSPKDKEDLDKILEETDTSLEVLRESYQKLSLLYFIRDMVEFEGYKIEIG